jgi:hypothetical protein
LNEPVEAEDSGTTAEDVGFFLNAYEAGKKKLKKARN